MPFVDEIAVARAELGTRRIPYADGLTEQKRIHQLVRDGDAPPTILMLEHDAVFTAGRRTQPTDILGLATEVIESDRGGRITWHGPGQIVCYPIVRLPHPLDVLAYVRTLEQAMIDTCSAFGVKAARVDGRSGVWCNSATGPSGITEQGAQGADTRKIGAVGVRVAGGVTMHGIALNVDCSLGWTREIVPCGIADAGVTTLLIEQQRHGLPAAPLLDVADILETCLVNNLSGYLATGTEPTGTEPTGAEPAGAEPAGADV